LCKGPGSVRVKQIEFQKLTDEFENKLLNAALGSPEKIPALVDEYSSSVIELFNSPSSSQ